MITSLVALNGFYLLLSTQLTADLTSEWSVWSMFHLLPHIYAKTPFCSVEAVAKNTESSTCCFWLTSWANVASTLKIAFSLTNVHAKWWIHCLLIYSSPLLSHATLIYDRPKRVLRSFLVISRTTAEVGWPERSASFVSVLPRLKSAYHPLTIVCNGADSG